MLNKYLIRKGHVWADEVAHFINVAIGGWGGGMVTVIQSSLPIPVNPPQQIPCTLHMLHNIPLPHILHLVLFNQ